MAKAAQISSNSAPEKCKNSSIYFEDRISHLPDDILIIILSLLTLQEAARTSVLSSRWKNMWMYFRGILDFDASKALWKVSRRKKDLELERSKYVSWVNQVFNFHKGTTIEKFRVSFDLDKSYGVHVDRWINLAIEKRVQRLELNLKRLHYNQKEGRYCFPSDSHVLSSLKNLTSLRLDCVDVSGEVVEYLLSNCLFLEELHVVDSTLVASLKVSGPSLKLKSLVIVRCWDVEYIEISSVNLVSFKFHGVPSTRLLLENVPNLKVLSLFGCYADDIIYKFHQWPSYLLHLEKLKLYWSNEVHSNFPKIPQLRNLRQLELSVGRYMYQSFLPCIALLNASPFLYRFAIALQTDGGSFTEIKKVGIAKNPKLKSIKVVEMVNFAGYEEDVKLAEYLLENAVSLEKMTIDTRDLISMGSQWEYDGRLRAKWCEPRLKKKLRRGVSFEMI